MHGASITTSFVHCICVGSNGSQFRGVSAGQHFINVEKVNSADQAMALLVVNISERVVSFTNLLSKQYKYLNFTCVFNCL